MESNQYLCPNCGINLDSISSDKGMYYHCDKCDGKLISAVSLRRNDMSNHYFMDIWKEAKKQSHLSDKRCPSCNHPMSKVITPFEPNIELDICPTCMLFWFDKEEYEKIPFDNDGKTPEERKKEIDSKKKVDEIYKKAVAETKLHEMENEKIPIIHISEYPSRPLGIIAPILGLPYEADKSALEKLPIVTWSFSLLSIIIYIVFLNNNYDVINALGFRPNFWYKDFGATIFTSMILHTSLLHILGNLYYLNMLGDDVEDMLGKKQYILFMLSSHILGLFLHTILTHDKTIPAVGSSIVVSGILGYYIVSFPNRLIEFGFISFRVNHRAKGWLQFPAWFYFGFWALLQLIGSIKQTSHTTSVSYLAHLGGLLWGIFIGFMSKAIEKDKLDALTP